MKFLDLFAGIGGFRLGMEQAGHECVGCVEIDKYARKSYEAIYDTEEEWTAHDITTVADDDLEFLGGKGIDVICGGFPCQTFSVAGKRGGFDDTRGTLFFEIARIAKQIKPRILLLENVKGLLSHEKGKTYRTILNTLDELGYDAEWQVLNSKNFGVPQNRERIFIVGHLRGQPRQEVFPIEGKNTNAISVFGYCVLITGASLRKRENMELEIRKDGLSNSLTQNVDHHLVKDSYRIRKLTPKECWRLQGFPDELFNKAAEVNSNSQLYKQAGNSVTVNVVHEIAKRLWGLT